MRLSMLTFLFSAKRSQISMKSRIYTHTGKNSDPNKLVRNKLIHSYFRMNSQNESISDFELIDYSDESDASDEMGMEDDTR